MNQDPTNCSRQLEHVRSSVLALLQSFEKGTHNEVARTSGPQKPGVPLKKPGSNSIAPRPPPESRRVRNLCSKMADPQATTNSLPSTHVNEDGTNTKVVICLHCGSRILSPNVAKLCTDGSPVAVPLPLQRRDVTEVQTEPIAEWWVVTDKFHFDNVGFTRSAADGRRYLSCSDCDLAPIGWVDEATNHNMVAVNRVAYK